MYNVTPTKFFLQFLAISIFLCTFFSGQIIFAQSLDSEYIKDDQNISKNAASADAKKKVIQSARKRSSQGDHRLAGEIIKAGIRRFGGDDQLYFYLGLYLFKSGAAEDAIPNLERSIQMLDMDATPHYILGKALWKNKQYYEALVEMYRARRYNRDHIGSIMDTAHILREVGEYQAARLYFLQGLIIKPDSETLINGLLTCDSVEGISPLSEKAYQTWLKKHPKDMVVRRNLISILLYRKKFEEAWKVMKKLPENDPKRTGFKLHILRGMKEFKQILKTEKELTAEEKADPQVAMTLLEAHVGLKNFEAAIQFGLNTIKEHPYHVRGYMLTAFAYTHTGKFTKARTHYTKALLLASTQQKKEIQKNLKLLDRIIKETGGDL